MGVDAAPSMVEHAREALGDARRVFQANLSTLSSTSRSTPSSRTRSFHWIPDHPRLFERLHAALRPGGALEAQYGGYGNVERFHRVGGRGGGGGAVRLAPRGLGGPWNFTDDEQARGWL